MRELHEAFAGAYAHIYSLCDDTTPLITPSFHPALHTPTRAHYAWSNIPKRKGPESNLLPTLRANLRLPHTLRRSQADSGCIYHWNF